MNRELQDVRAGFRNGIGTRYQISNILRMLEKVRQFHKSIYFCFIDYDKAFDCMDHNWKILKRCEYQATLFASWETCMQVKKQQLKSDMEQWTGTIGERVCKGCILSPCIFNPLPATQEKTVHMDIIRWSTPKSDWLYSLQPKMENLYTVSKNKTGSWLWLRSWTPYCQI